MVKRLQLLVAVALLGSVLAAAGSRPADIECDIVGTPADDVLVGTAGGETICGLGGNDVIRGLRGDDVIYGGAGDDTIVAGGGDDRVFGGSGNDVIEGGRGRDRLVGQSGNDDLVGGPARGRLLGGPGFDNCVDQKLVVHGCEMRIEFVEVAGIVVDTRIAEDVVGMVNAAAQAGVILEGYGRRRPPGPLRVINDHGQGLAIDFAATFFGSDEHDWLVANAAAYGFAQRRGESWHWISASYSGDLELS